MLTPGELDAFYRRYVQAREREDLLVGILASAVVNFSFCAPKRQVGPEDFGLGLRSKPARPRTRMITLSDAELADQWRGFISSTGVGPKGSS
jgi:hypothetical protein